MTIKSMLLVNGDRLNHSIDRLAEIGEQPNGGVGRIAYNLEDLQARQLIKTWIAQAGKELMSCYKLCYN